MTSIKRALLRLVFSAIAVFLAPECVLGADTGSGARPPWDYTLGQGLKLGDSNFTLGGYIAAEYEDAEEGGAEFLFDDVSFFLSGNVGKRVNFFSEFENAHFLKVPLHGRSSLRSDWKLERLYADYLLRDEFVIRAGKFLTPVGTWNEIHADPLTWTVSRPIVTAVMFPQFITGIGAHGYFTAHGEDFGYDLYFQNNNGLDENTGARKTRRAFGGRIRWTASAELEAGVPLLYYADLGRRRDAYLTGLDLTYKSGRVEVRAEGSYSIVDHDGGRDSNEYGYYVEGIYSVTQRHFLVVRNDYAAVCDMHKGRESAWSFGAVYKPFPQVVFKIEYQLRNGDLEFEGDDVDEVGPEDRFLAAFSLLL